MDWYRMDNWGPEQPGQGTSSAAYEWVTMHPDDPTTLVFIRRVFKNSDLWLVSQSPTRIYLENFNKWWRLWIRLCYPWYHSTHYATIKSISGNSAFLALNIINTPSIIYLAWKWHSIDINKQKSKVILRSFKGHAGSLWRRLGIW